MKKTIKKRAFISAIAMLIVSAIVLTSSTFAWFSMAKKVNVETMELNITSPEGVQISGNTSAFTTTLTKDDLFDGPTARPRFKAYTGHSNRLPEVLSPASSRFGTQQADGFLPKFFSGKIGDNGRLGVSAVASEADLDAVIFDLFVYIAEAQPIYFGKSTVTCSANADVPCAMRIGVVNCGTVDKGAEGATVINKKPTLNANATNRNAVMLLPNAAHHTDYAIEHNSAVEGVPGTTRYFAYEGQNLLTVGAIREDTSLTVEPVAVEATNADDAYFNAAAGVNKLRVYLWMEGNDVDCSNDVAGSTINFDFVLTLDPPSVAA